MIEEKYAEFILFELQGMRTDLIYASDEKSRKRVSSSLSYKLSAIQALHKEFLWSDAYFGKEHIDLFLEAMGKGLVRDSGFYHQFGPKDFPFSREETELLFVAFGKGNGMKLIERLQSGCSFNILEI